jgi:hypothetical protein
MYHLIAQVGGGAAERGGAVDAGAGDRAGVIWRWRRLADCADAYPPYGFLAAIGEVAAPQAAEIEEVGAAPTSETGEGE